MKALSLSTAACVTLIASYKNTTNVEIERGEGVVMKYDFEYAV